MQRGIATRAYSLGLVQGLRPYFLKPPPFRHCIRTTSNLIRTAIFIARSNAQGETLERPHCTLLQICHSWLSIQYARLRYAPGLEERHPGSGGRGRPRADERILRDDQYQLGRIRSERKPRRYTGARARTKTRSRPAILVENATKH